jgi:putative ABC transport system permease protein
MNRIALQMLLEDSVKYLGLVMAIAFSTFLLENQTGIFVGIMKRTANQIHDVTDAEVWAMDPDTLYFDETKGLKDTELSRVRSVEGVEWAVPLFKGNPVARTPSGHFCLCIALGLDDATLAGAPRKMVLGSWERLREPESIVVDRAGYYLLFPGEPLALDRTVEMNDRRVRIVGISEASAAFVSLPIIHARYTEAVNFQGTERSRMSFVLARPRDGVSPEELCRRIAAQTGLRARTTDEFRWDCIRYYLVNTGIPVNFAITIVIAVLIGTLVAGLTFYLFTVEHIRQFATLKAVGVTNRKLVRMILLQAFTAGAVGFSLGTGMAAVFFEVMSLRITARGMILPWENVALTAACMFFVVIVASLLSIRRVLVLEPAIVFR